MTTEQTLSTIRALGLYASFDATHEEFIVDYRADDARHVQGELGFGTAFHVEAAEFALSAAGRMATAAPGVDANAL